MWNLTDGREEVQRFVRSSFSDVCTNYSNQTVINQSPSSASGADNSLPLAPAGDDSSLSQNLTSTSSNTEPEQNPSLDANNPQKPSAIQNHPRKQISPQDVIPIPKVDPSKEGAKKKKFKGSGKAQILTASPYRNELSKDDQISQLKEQARLLQQECKKTPASGSTVRVKPKKKKFKKLHFIDEKPAKPRKSIDENPGTSGEISSATEAPTVLPAPITTDKLNKGDFILVKLGAKHWVGYICRKISPAKPETRFLRRKATKKVENLSILRKTT